MDLVSRLSFSPKRKVLAFITQTLHIDHHLLVNLAKSKNDRVRQASMLIFDNLFLALRSSQSVSLSHYLNNDMFLSFTTETLPRPSGQIRSLAEENSKYISYILQQW